MKLLQVTVNDKETTVLVPDNRIHFLMFPGQCVL